MNRRQLIKNCVGLVALSQLQPLSADDSSIAYTREVYETAVAGGKPFMLDFYASW